jgi:ABC-2 type transport system permease protein
MKKFLAVINAFWQRSFAYRFTIFAYRVGELGEILILVLMWRAIYSGGGNAGIKGFSENEMITYVLIGNFFRMIIRNFLSNVIAIDIKEGRLSMYLIRPMRYFHYVLSREVGRILLVSFISLVSQSLLILSFSHTFIWNSDPVIVGLTALMVALAFITELFISYLVGLIAFWTDEVDGIYTTVDRLKQFFSGGYFPISLLPATFVRVSFLLPFAYSFFVPAQIYLGKIDPRVGAQGIAVQLVWIVVLYALIRVVWKRGLVKYEGVGM